MKNYNIKLPAGQRTMSGLCAKITELYPNIKLDEIKKYGDSSEMARLSDGEKRITAELDTASGRVTLASDIPLKELYEHYYALEIESDDGGNAELSRHRAAERFRRLPSRFLGLFKKPAFIKYAVIPIALIAACSLLYVDPFFYALLSAVGIFLGLGAFLGWIWWLPVIPAALLSAYGKSGFVTKAITMSLLPMGAAYFSAVQFRTGAFYWEEFRIILLGLGIFSFGSLLTIYILLMPIMAIDDICQHRRKVIHGKSCSFWRSAAGWAYAVVGSAAIMLISFAVGNYADSAEVQVGQMLYDAEAVCYSTVREKYDTFYGDDMQAVAEYAVRYGCTDWAECPDESLEASWTRLTEAGVYPYVELKGRAVIFTVKEYQTIYIETEILPREEDVYAV